MKKFIVKGMLLFILALNPAYVTNSSNKINDFNTQKLVVNNRINDLHRMINKEYYLFYTNLYQQDLNISKSERDGNFNFILELSYHAIDSESLPSIALSQAILETGFGKSKKLKYNIFGIKGKGIITKTKEFYNNKFITIQDEFQNFNSLSDAFNKHYRIIGKYVPQNREYEEWAYSIKNNGYATDPRYAKKLIYLIEKYQLHRLDNIQTMNVNLEKLISIKYDNF